MPTSDYGQYVTASTVETATTGALSGDGSSGDKLAVSVDGTTIDVSAGNALEARGLLADWTVANGKALRTDTTTAHTAKIQAYDVDGTAYKTFGTLTNGNTPDFSIVPPSGGTVTLQATTYKSSDASTGITQDVTTGTLVGKTMTFKNGLLVDFS